MKKTLLIFLLLISIPTFGAFTSDYQVEWFETSEKSDVSKTYKDLLIINEEGFSSAFTEEGRRITSEPFDGIYVTDSDCILSASEFYFDERGITYYTIDKNGNILNKHKLDSGNSLNDINNSFFSGAGAAIFGDDISGAWRFGDYILLEKNSETMPTAFTYAIAGNDGNIIRDFIYNKILYSDDHPNIIVLVNDETKDAALINRKNGKTVYGKIIYSNLETAYFEKDLFYITEDAEGKYYIFNESLQQIAEGSSPAGVDNSLSVSDGNERYVYDDKGELAYKGSENVVSSFFGRYVVFENGKLKLTDKEFNELLPAEYEYIRPIAENVWIVEKDGKRIVINNGKKVIGEFDRIINRYNYILAYNIDERGFIDGNGSTVYDFEGNVVYSGKESLYFTENRIIVSADGKVGKLISYNSNPFLKIEGEYLYNDTLPRIRNNITLVPIRAISEKLGFDVEYISGSGEIKITKDGKEMSYILGNKTAIIDGEEKELAAPPEIINGRTLVPLRAVCDAFGLSVEWDGERRTVSLKE